MGCHLRQRLAKAIVLFIARLHFLKFLSCASLAKAIAIYAFPENYEKPLFILTIMNNWCYNYKK